MTPTLPNSMASCSDRSAKLVLCSILLISSLLRVFPVLQGLPDMYVNDEIFEAKRAVALLRGDYDFHRKKGVYFNFLAVAYALHGNLAVLSGRHESIEEYVSDSIVAPGELILIGRIMTVLFGTLSVLILYRLGRKHLFPREPTLAILLALAWAVCPFAIWHSHWLLIENCVLVFTLLSFLSILPICDNPRYLYYLFAAICIAVATATKVYCAALCVPLLMAHFVGHQKAGRMSFRQRVCDPRLAFFFSCFAAATLLASPSYAYLAYQAHTPGEAFSLLTASAGMPESPLAPQRTLLYANHVRWAVGNFAILLLAVGLVSALFKRDVKLLIMGSYSILFIVMLMVEPNKQFVHEWYILSALPGFYVMIVNGAATLIRCINRRWQSRIVTTALMGVLAAYFVGESLHTMRKCPAYWQRITPVQIIARDWVESYVPPGSTLVMRGYGVWPGHHAIPVFDLKENYIRQHEAAVESRAYVGGADVLLDFAKAEVAPRFDLVIEPVRNQHTSGEKSVRDYIHDGADFFCVRILGPSDPQQIRRIQELHAADDVEIAMRHSGMTLQGVPMTIEIYKVNR